MIGPSKIAVRKVWGFRLSGLEFRVWGVRFAVEGLGCGGWDLGSLNPKPSKFRALGFEVYARNSGLGLRYSLEGRGDFVNIAPKSRIVAPVISIINLVTKSPLPSTWGSMA